MLPFSLIETKAWKTFMKVFDPCFNIPTRKTVKTSGLTELLTTVNTKIKNILKSMPYVNVSVDGWSDAVMRCFNGYIVQGIDMDWNMHTIPIAFQYVSGPHTGKAIKKQYDEISSQYGIDNKTFKIVADQAANVKKAFSKTLETCDVLTITTNLMRRQAKKDKLEKAEKDRIEAEALAVNELNTSIENMNAKCSSPSEKPSRKRTAEQVLTKMCDENEDLYEDTEEADISNEICEVSDSTDKDADSNISNNDTSTDFEDDDKYAYEPCACHNIQLVLKDGFKEVPEIEELIKNISKNIVNRSKFSVLIAEELRNFGKKFAKRVVTRFNSVLFTARSVLAVSNEQFQKIRNKMPTKTKKEKNAKKCFDLSAIDRELLKELVVVLEWFEWVSDEFQSNRVTISRVYPCVDFLRDKLSDVSHMKHTQVLCEHLLESLESRFGSLINKEVN